MIFSVDDFEFLSTLWPILHPCQLCGRVLHPCQLYGRFLHRCQPCGRFWHPCQLCGRFLHPLLTMWTIFASLPTLWTILNPCQVSDKSFLSECPTPPKFVSEFFVLFFVTLNSETTRTSGFL
uniref:Uncharacterized protein n=1 Tax=Cacopsylla melanoneura TaxID=428564 RepID=A0A8D8Z7C2_9HEMI